jgi:hypothetical protein
MIGRLGSALEWVGSNAFMACSAYVIEFGGLTGDRRSFIFVSGVRAETRGGV